MLVDGGIETPETVGVAASRRMEYAPFDDSTAAARLLVIQFSHSCAACGCGATLVIPPKMPYDGPPAGRTILIGEPAAIPLISDSIGSTMIALSPRARSVATG